MKLDSKACETISVSAVRDSIVLSPYLDQFIADNDKEPSWDGFAYVYNDKSKKSSCLAGRVAVQVKGTQDGKYANKDSFLFSVAIKDLRNYLNDGGVMYFVVYVDGDGPKTTIYYSALTPVKIRSVLEKTSNKKTISIEFKKFPIDGDKKASLFLDLHTNSQMLMVYHKS